MNDSYYTETAYDSAGIKNLPLIDNRQLSATARRLRKHPLHRLPVAQCKEFLVVDPLKIIELLNSDSEETKRDITAPGNELQQWQTLRNPKAVLEIVTAVMGIFSFISWVGVMLFALYFLLTKPLLFLKGAFYKLLFLPSIFIVIHYVGKYLKGKNIFIDKNNIILNRRKGTILCPSKEKPTQELPFEEFDAYLGTSLNSSGLTCYHLWLCHRYSELWVSHPGEHYEEWRIYQLWEFWQQYMDVSQPLPDTPRMEPFRSRDPVTAAYDSQHDRPRDYWKNMDLDAAEKMQDTSLVAGSKYPWGQTREQALARGWRPSGVGEGDWRGHCDQGEPLEKVKNIL